MVAGLIVRLRAGGGSIILAPDAIGVAPIVSDAGAPLGAGLTVELPPAHESTGRVDTPTEAKASTT